MWDIEKHGPLYQKWAAARGYPELDLGTLSTVGFVADGIVAGFLFVSDGGTAFVDGYMSDPESDKAKRAEAIEAIGCAILQVAGTLPDIKRLVFASPSPSLAEHAKQHGFETVAGWYGTKRMA